MNKKLIKENLRILEDFSIRVKEVPYYIKTETELENWRKALIKERLNKIEKEKGY